MSTITTSEFVRPIGGTDLITWYNDQGTAVVKNQLIGITEGANQGLVVVAQEAIASGASGLVAKKGIFQFPAAASVMTAGQTVQYVPAAASVSVGGTATGTFAVGQCVEKIGTGTGYVKVDINVGSKAFYIW